MNQQTSICHLLLIIGCLEKCPFSQLGRGISIKCLFLEGIFNPAKSPQQAENCRTMKHQQRQKSASKPEFGHGVLSLQRSHRQLAVCFLLAELLERVMETEVENNAQHFVVPIILTWDSCSVASALGTPVQVRKADGQNLRIRSEIWNSG